MFIFALDPMYVLNGTLGKKNYTNMLHYFIIFFLIFCISADLANFPNRGFPIWLKYVPGIEFRTDNEPFKVK